MLATLLALAVSAPPGELPPPPREPDLAPAEREAAGMPLPPPPVPETEGALEEPPPLAPPPDGWADVTHEAVARGIFGIVDWFDRFFTDSRQLEIGRSESFFSLQGALRLSSTGRLTPGYGVRVSASMPRLFAWFWRVRIIVVGVTAETKALPLTDPGSAPGAPGQIAPQSGVEIRYDLIREQRVVMDVGSGVLFGWPSQVFGRLRLRWMQPLWKDALVRLTPAGFWVSGPTGIGTTVQVDLEQRVSEADRLRVSTAVGITQASYGWSGGMELAYFHAFSPTSALSASASWIAAAKPFPYAKLFRVSVRLRQAFWRKWLFFELEPEVLWPKDPGAPRQREEGIILRLEVHFDSSTFMLK